MSFGQPGIILKLAGKPRCIERSALQFLRTIAVRFINSWPSIATRMCGVLPLALRAVAVLSAVPLRSEESPVSAELIVPPAATHVIGDHTPLIWRFHNNTAEPLAFMWEGCCRLNGRLTVTAQNQPIAPVPPGQALAHMFAKAERLEPGKPADFETRLSDWVQLHESGEYQLEGRYTGVLPEQTPQIPRGLDLWRDAATTLPIRLRLSSVADYLSQRSARAAERGLRLELAGPAKLPPLQPSPFALELHNASAREQRVVWPNDFQLWIVDATGRRLGNVPTSVEGSYQELSIPPGARLPIVVPFDSGLIEGEPFGNYQVFVDLRQGDAGQPRAPSNPVDMTWRLGPPEIEQLLRQAADGSRLGMRNAPLKLLRIYLGDIASALATVDPSDASPALLALRDQLRLASCLKPHAPIPGRVELPLVVAVDGTSSLASPAVEDCLTAPGRQPTASVVARLKQLLSVRRHLGWEVGLDVRPDPDATLGVIRNALEPYLEPSLDLAAVPRALVSDGTTNAPLPIVFRAEPIPAGLLLRLRKEIGTIVFAAARKVGASRSSRQADGFKPDEVFAAPFKPIPDPSILSQWLDPQTQILVLADADLTWSEMLVALEPLIERRLPFDLCLPRPASGP